MLSISLFYDKIFFTKGVYMQVSAVSANHFQSKKIVENFVLKTKPAQTDSSSDMSFNFSAPMQKQASIERLSLYECINEWKDFCHKRILSGKLDIIA